MSLAPLWLVLLVLLLPLPVGTNRRLRRIPWITYSLIVLNVCFFVGPAFSSHVTSLMSVLVQWGCVPQSVHAQPLHYAATLLTYMFLHYTPAHLFWNMVFLWVFGPHVEDALGHAAYLALYIGGGMVAALLHTTILLLLLPHSLILNEPLVGASGAISAILAPFVIRYYRSHIRLLWLPGLIAQSSWADLEVPSVYGLGLWLLQNLAGALHAIFEPQKSGDTAYWAHIGGFAFGLLAAEMTHLFQEGHQDYLLQDARDAAGIGYEALTAAVEKYQAFLDLNPQDASVRIELARALAQRAGQNAHGHDRDRNEAITQITTGVRQLSRQDDLVGALRGIVLAHALDLPLVLSARERLRLGSAAISQGDGDTAADLLRAIVTETPDAPEDEMARLKLGQLLQRTQPDESQMLLTSFLEKYPQSQWASLVRQLTRP